MGEARLDFHDFTHLWIMVSELSCFCRWKCLLPRRQQSTLKCHLLPCFEKIPVPIPTYPNVLMWGFPLAPWMLQRFIVVGFTASPSSQVPRRHWWEHPATPPRWWRLVVSFHCHPPSEHRLASQLCFVSEVFKSDPNPQKHSCESTQVGTKVPKSVEIKPPAWSIRLSKELSWKVFWQKHFLLKLFPCLSYPSFLSVRLSTLSFQLLNPPPDGGTMVPVHQPQQESGSIRNHGNPEQKLRVSSRTLAKMIGALDKVDDSSPIAE